jgi:hypothetical protein
MKRRRSDKRIRKRKARARIIERYVRELERSRVPPSSVKAATTMMLLLLGGRGNL